MFSQGISKLLICFVLYSMFVDISCALKMKRGGQYNSFELSAGSYADVAFLATITIIVLHVLNVEVSVEVLKIILNIILALVYCGMFKVLLQKLIRSKYFWVDTKEEEKDIRRINRKRTTLFVSYFLFMLFFRNLALTIDDGVTGNIIAIIGVLWFSKSASKKCSRIKNKIRKEESKELNKG